MFLGKQKIVHGSRDLKFELLLDLVSGEEFSEDEKRWKKVVLKKQKLDAKQSLQPTSISEKKTWNKNQVTESYRSICSLRVILVIIIYLVHKVDTNFFTPETKRKTLTRMGRSQTLKIRDKLFKWILQTNFAD